MRYVKTFVQEGRRYSEEISEEQYKFYTGPNYKAGDSSHKIHVIEEQEKPVANEDEEIVVDRLEVDDNGAKEFYKKVAKPVVEPQPETVNIVLPKEDADLLMQLLRERRDAV